MASPNKGLLNKQLASITDTLAKASKRRDTEIQKKVSREVSREPTPVPSARSDTPVPAVPTSRPDKAAIEDGFEGNGAEIERLVKSGFGFIGMVMRANARADLPVDTKDGAPTIPRVTLRGGETLESSVDPQQLLAELGRNGSSEDKEGPQMEHDDPRSILSRLGRNISSVDKAPPQPADDDPGQMLAELRRHASTEGMLPAATEDDDPNHGLAELGRNIHKVDTAPSHFDDPKRMLAELRQSAGSGDTQSPRTENGNNPNALHTDLTTRLSLMSKVDIEGEGVPAVPIQTRPVQALKKGLPNVCLPYAIALQLSRADSKWEEVKGFTEYLFSEGLNGHGALQEKEVVLQRVFLELEQIEEQALKEEEAYSAVEEKTNLPCRLIVTNIAADANWEDVALAFHQFKWDIRSVILLDERHPVYRTRTAYIDMLTRIAAKHASHTIGSIFGLFFNVRLAVEDAG